MSQPIAFITGIFGQDAAYLAEIALRANFRVIGAARNIGNQEKYWRLAHLKIKDDIQFIELDLTSDTSVNLALEQHQPALIFNLAAQSSVAESMRHPFATLNSTLMGAVRIFEAQRRFCPTARVFQPASVEMDQPWRSPYAAAKGAAHGISQLYRRDYRLYISNAILSNHESPLRDEVFVSKKIVKSLVEISQGRRHELLLGNLNSSRDWSHARDVMSAAWNILQLDQPGDFHLLSGLRCSVRDFVSECAAQLGMALCWEGSAMAEIGIHKQTQKTIIKVSPEFFRPTDPTPPTPAQVDDALVKLNWHPQCSIKDIIHEMIEFELAISTGK